MTQTPTQTTDAKTTVLLRLVGIVQTQLEILLNAHFVVIQSKILQMSNVTMVTLQVETDAQLLVKLRQIRIVIAHLMDVQFVETDRLMFLNNVTMGIL